MILYNQINKIKQEENSSKVKTSLVINNHPPSVVRAEPYAEGIKSSDAEEPPSWALKCGGRTSE